MSFNQAESMQSQVIQAVKDLLRHYCSELPEDVVLNLFKKSIYILTSSEIDSTELSNEEYDEFTICHEIEKQLNNLQRPQAIHKFFELHRKLSKGNLVTNRSGVLLFLLKLSEGRHATPGFDQIISKLRIVSKRSKTPNNSFTNGDCSEGNWVSLQREPSPSIVSSSIPRPSTLSSQNNNASYKKGHSHDSAKDIFSNTAHSPISAKTFAKSNGTNVTIGTMSYKCGRLFAPESSVLSDLIYSFQGIGGDIIRLDHEGNFSIDPQVEVKSRSVVEGLLEVGYLHNKVLNLNTALSKVGSVGQGVHAAVTYRLRDYYGFIGHLSSKVAGQCGGEDTPLREEEGSQGQLTYRTLRTLMRYPINFLQTLVDALVIIASQRGGAIISLLHTLSHHGDQRVSEIIKFLLSYAGKPLMKMIQSWVVHGELIDPYDEFFIAINKNCDNRDIWLNKFHIRKQLIPNVITEKQADMILKCGKAIHFLNVICNRKVAITGSRLKLQLKDAEVVSLFEERSELSRLLVAIYEETSALVLDTLTNQFKLYQHFLGLRKYILLSQGDFATSLIHLLEPEMRKNAKKLHNYKLTGMLSAAIRASSASFDDTEITRRVTVKLLPDSEADSGYDIFSLHYIMNEPIDTAFKLNDGAYSHMFNFLWRTKSMNHILMNLVNNRRALKAKIFKLSNLIPEVKEVLVRADRLSMELVHFAKEFECYLQFEVIECVWEKFSDSFQKAMTLDDVIAAHDNFISTVQTQTFLDPESRKFINDLRLIWELVCSLEGLEERFLGRVVVKLDEKEEDAAIAKAEGVTWADESDIRIKDKEFILYLSSVKAQYDIFIRSYQDVLKKFLLELSMRKDYQLRMLSARLDYNEYYKRSDSRITDSMKFSRCSDIFMDLVA